MQPISQLYICRNNAYRQDIKYNLRESVKELQLLCERSDVKHIFALCKLSFCWMILRLGNRLMKACYSVYSIGLVGRVCRVTALYVYNVDIGTCLLVR